MRYVIHSFNSQNFPKQSSRSIYLKLRLLLPNPVNILANPGIHSGSVGTCTATAPADHTHDHTVLDHRASGVALAGVLAADAQQTSAKHVVGDGFVEHVLVWMGVIGGLAVGSRNHGKIHFLESFRIKWLVLEFINKKDLKDLWR